MTTTARGTNVKRYAALTALTTTLLLCSGTAVLGQDPQPPQDPCAEVDCNELARRIADQEAAVNTAGEAVGAALDVVSDAEAAVQVAQMAVATADWGVSAATWDIAMLEGAARFALTQYLDEPSQENVDALDAVNDQLAAAWDQLADATATLHAAELALAAAEASLAAAEAALAEAQSAFYAELAELETLRGIQAMCCD